MKFYAFARVIVLSLCKILFRVTVKGRENVPPSGAYIVAPSHRSLIDTPFTAFVTKRRIRFMAKKELFQNPVGKWLFSSLGGIPVDRGSATARTALKAIEGALRAGEPAAVFPEGTRNYGPEIEELFDGAAYLSVKLGLPIVPVGIGGSEQILASGKVLPRLQRVALVIGAPIYPPESAGTRKRSDLQGITADLKVSLQDLFTEALQTAGYS